MSRAEARCPCRRTGRARQALADPHLLRPFDGGEVQRALPQEPGQGPDRPVHRLRSADPDRLRLRPRAGARRGRQGRRAGLAPRRHAHAARRHPARRDEHVDDDQRDGRLAAGALRRHRRRARRAAHRAHRHHPERHHQGVPVARHLRLPARAVAAADQGHDHLHRASACRSGTRPTCAPTTCRRPGRRRCRSWPSRSPPRRPCSTPSRPRARWRRPTSAPVVGRISFFVNAGLRFVTEICKMRAFTELWDEITAKRYGVQRSQASPVPLRRAGQLAGPHRAAAGEQRLPHPARDAGGDAVAATRAPAPCSCRPGTRRSACRGRGTSSGRSACSRSWPTKPTCSNTPTCSRARR